MKGYFRGSRLLILGTAPYFLLIIPLQNGVKILDGFSVETQSLFSFFLHSLPLN